MRVGIDLGGTKIEGVLMAADSSILCRIRVPSPKNDYSSTINSIKSITSDLELRIGSNQLRIGIAHPGSISRTTGRIQNANSITLNGQDLLADLQKALGSRVRLANDADCLGVSEQADGAAAGRKNVFAIILGTGVGGGCVINGKLLSGPNAIAGEWGHNPLPWQRQDWNEFPGPLHWDGRHSPIEAWLSGPGMARDHLDRTGQAYTAKDIAFRAAQGISECEETLQRYENRLARSLASVINVLDPEVIVVGGGLSNMARIYDNVPKLWSQWIFSDSVQTQLLPAKHGDSSGVRGAAWLWPATSSE